MTPIQVYYGMKGNDGRHEWYIFQNGIHYGCIVKEGKHHYRFDNATIYPDGARFDRIGKTFTSLRAAAESYGTITNSLFIEHLHRLWDQLIYMPFWDAYYAVTDLFRKRA